MSLVDETVRVKKGGSYLTIPTASIDRYMAKGYDVVDDKGNVLRASIPNDINALRVAYSQHVAEIRELKQHIKELETQLREAGKLVEKSADVKATTTRKSKKA